MPLLVVPQGTTFLLSSRLDSALSAATVKYYSPAERLGKGSGPKRLVKYSYHPADIWSEVVGVAKVVNN